MLVTAAAHIGFAAWNLLDGRWDLVLVGAGGMAIALWAALQTSRALRQDEPTQRERSPSPPVQVAVRINSAGW
jgi:hypothetical protein